MLRILLLCDYSREPDRRLLTGVVKYANERGGWAFFQAPPALRTSQEHAMEIISRAKKYRVDAIFGNWSGIKIDEARALGIPIILRKENRIYDDFPFLSGRNQQIGEMAADYFLERHYRSYAFFGLNNIIWTAERMDGFRNRVSGHGQFSSMLAPDLSKHNRKVETWLRELPKPVAIFASNDLSAQYISEVCHNAGIAIPDEIALMGADNDEFLCNISYPGLTSINLDFERQGYNLAKKIEEMVTNHEIKPYRILLEPLGIVERGSTLKHRITDPYIKELVEKMERQYTDNITIKELVSDIPLSRRSIEMRFHAEMAPYTMLQYITSLRLKHFASLLKDTSLPVSEAAVQSGFDDPYKVFALFRKKYGCTPNEFRKKARSE